VNQGQVFARLEAVEDVPRGADPEAMQDQTVHVGHNQVGRYQLAPVLDRGAERAVRLGVVPIAGARQREPSAAIDE
jgi:hypothetical protein